MTIIEVMHVCLPYWKSVMDTSLGFRLNKQSRESVQARTGMTVSDISNMTNGDIRRNLESRLGKKIPASAFKDVTGELGRGQVYAFADRLISQE